MKTMRSNLNNRYHGFFSVFDFLFRKVSFLLLILIGLLLLCPNTFAYPRTPGDLIEISCGKENQNEKKVLIVYDTIHGSTAEVAETIGNDLCTLGFQVDVRFARSVSNIDTYDAVIVGSSIYRFKWLPDAMRFLNRNQKTLEHIPTAFFIVCSALYQDTPESRIAVKEAFVDPVLEKYPDIEPLSVGLFGGAVDFNTNCYTLFEKFVLLILGKILGFTDSADWRNWDAVKAWSEEVGELIR